MRDYNHIENLLERYYNAQTSEQEEQELKDFFCHEEVPALSSETLSVGFPTIGKRPRCGRHGAGSVSETLAKTE